MTEKATEPRLTGLPFQLFTPLFGGQSIADVAKDLEENYKLHTGIIADGRLAGCRLTSYANINGIVRGVLAIPDNPVQIIFRYDQESDYLKIDMIELEYAKPSQIRAAVKYISPLQIKVVGGERRRDLTEEYNAASMQIMRAKPEERANVKKLIKGEFLAKHGKDYSKSFDEAMYRRGYKKYKKPR